MREFVREYLPKVEFTPSEIVVKPVIRVQSSQLVKQGDTFVIPKIVVNLEVIVDP
jgi:hypothetical protein